MLGLLIANLVVSSLALVAVVVDIFVSVRFARPFKKRNAQKDLAFIAVSAAEQKFRGMKGKGQDKARYARQYLIDHGITPAHADVLVERAVTETRLTETKPA